MRPSKPSLSSNACWDRRTSPDDGGSGERGARALRAPLSKADGSDPAEWDDVAGRMRDGRTGRLLGWPAERRR
nr:hypothetical protein KitaXyl93_68170 [Kitasatospora sp. Xyl93]